MTRRYDDQATQHRSFRQRRLRSSLSVSITDPDPARGRKAPTSAYAIIVPATVPVTAMAGVPMTVMPTTIVPMPMVFAATVMDVAMVFAATVMHVAMMFAATVMHVAMMFAATMMSAAMMFAAAVMSATMMFATVATAMPSQGFGGQHQRAHISNARAA